jgi:hypothetical protein
MPGGKGRFTIVVCGMNHTGTSCVAEWLIKNGADPGDYDDSLNQKTPYVKYENKCFKNFCIKLAGIPGLHAPGDSIDRFIEFLRQHDGKTPLLLKYPKSVFCLEQLREIIGPGMKAVFVMRNWVDAIQSNMDKTGCSFEQIANYYYSSYRALLQYNGPVYTVCYERLKSGRDVDLLLEYCGLSRVQSK